MYIVFMSDYYFYLLNKVKTDICILWKSIFFLFGFFGFI